jgi:hypothetical protein
MKMKIEINELTQICFPEILEAKLIKFEVFVFYVP